VSKKPDGNDDLLANPEFLRFLRDHDTEGLPAGGAIPEGHQGVYVPTTKEWIEGMRFATEATLKINEARAKAAEDRARQIFQEEEGQS
jgi:hypothetical protein